jgi:hypothetical protein
MSVTDKALFVIERNLDRDLSLAEIATYRASTSPTPSARPRGFPSWNICAAAG